MAQDLKIQCRNANGEWVDIEEVALNAKTKHAHFQFKDGRLTEVWLSVGTRIHVGVWDQDERKYLEALMDPPAWDKISVCWVD